LASQSMFDRTSKDITQWDDILHITVVIWLTTLLLYYQTPGFAPFESTHDISQLEMSEATTMKDDLRYNALRSADARSESSHTEVEDWDTEGDVKTSRRRTWWHRVKAWKWLFDTGLLLLVVGLLVERRWRYSSKSHAFELAGDITGFAPEFSQQIVQFKPDPVFAPENASEFWNKETQHAWLDIVPGRSTPLRGLPSNTC
jgi:hypothetical protein